MSWVWGAVCVGCGHARHNHRAGSGDRFDCWACDCSVSHEGPWREYDRMRWVLLPDDVKQVLREKVTR